MFSKVRLIKWNVRLLILVVLFIFLLCPSVTFAYELLGYTWSSVDPLYYLMENWVGYKTRLAFGISINDWNATSTPVNFQYSASNYKVYLYEVYNDEVGWDGKYLLTVNSGTHRILYARALLNYYYTDDYGTNKRRSVSGHELGHVLGLDEMGYYDPVLMNQYTDRRYDTYSVYIPQQDDIDGVNDMYG